MNAADSPTLAEPPVRQFQKRSEPSIHYSNRGSQVIDTVEATPLKFDGRKLLPERFLTAVKAARERQTAILSDREKLMKGRTLKEAQTHAERALAVYGQQVANGRTPPEKPMTPDEVAVTWLGFTHRFQVNARILGCEASKACLHLADQLDSLAKDCATACTTLATAAGVHLENDAELGFQPTLKANADFWRSRSEQWEAEMANKHSPPPAVESVADVLSRFQLGELIV